MTNDNDIVYFGKLHWILFLGPIVLSCAAIFLGIKITQLKEIVFLVVFFALLWGLIIGINFYISSLTIKKKQMVLSTGLLTRKTVTISLNKIESVDIRQSILGGIFHYGSLIITGTGGTRYFIHFLNKPLTCRRYIEQLMNE